MYLPAISEHRKQLHISSVKQKYLLTKKVAISPTNLYFLEIISDCDIVLISQVKNFPT